MKRDHIGLKEMHLTGYSFCVPGESFARTFEYKKLLFARSWFSLDKNHSFLVWNDENWLNLKKSFWKVYHYSKCFCRYYTSFVFFRCYQYLRNFILSFKVSSLKNWKYLNNILIRYMHLFILNYPLQYAKRPVT